MKRQISAWQQKNNDLLCILRQSHQSQRNLQRQSESNTQLTRLLEESNSIPLSFQQQLLEEKARNGLNSGSDDDAGVDDESTAIEHVVNAIDHAVDAIDVAERAHVLCTDTPTKSLDTPKDNHAPSADRVPLRSNRKSSQP